MANIVELKDSSNTNCYPLTKAQAVYFDDGDTVEDHDKTINDIVKSNDFQITITVGRYDAANKTIATTTDNKCVFTSLIPCKTDKTFVPYIPGYPYVIHTYDSSQKLIYSASGWTEYDHVYQNKGGYMAIVLCKTPWSDFTESEAKALEEKMNVTDFDEIIDDIQFNSVRKIRIYVDPNNSNRLMTSYIPCLSETLVIPYIKDYPYTYVTYDSLFNTIQEYGSVSYGFPEIVHNKGGFIRVLFKKTDATDFTQAELTHIQNTFKIPTSISLEANKDNITYTICHRSLPSVKSVSVSNESKTRLVSSFIYCQWNSLIVPFVYGFKHIVYTFDSNYNFIAQIDPDFVETDTIVTNNKGGYISVLFARRDFSDFTTGSVDTLSKFFEIRQNIYLSVIRKDYYTPVLTIVDDDGRNGFIQEAQMLLSKGASGTAALIVDSVGKTDHMTLSQILELRDSGIEFVSHTNTHAREVFGNNYAGGRYCNFANVTNDAVYDELKTSRDFFVKYELNSDCIVWPWGNYPDGYNEHTNNPDPNDPLVTGGDDQRLRYARIAKEVGYKYGLNSTGGLVKSSYFDDMWIPRVTMYSDDEAYPLTYYTNFIDTCIDVGGWMILMTHANDPVYADLEKLTNVVDYALNNGVSVLNLKDAYAIKKPVISLGNFRDTYHRFIIGYDGLMYR